MFLLGDPKAHQAIPFEPFDTNRKRQRPVVQLMMRKDAQANIEVSNRKALDPRARAKGLGGAHRKRGAGVKRARHDSGPLLGDISEFGMSLEFASC